MVTLYMYAPMTRLRALSNATNKRPGMDTHKSAMHIFILTKPDTHAHIMFKSFIFLCLLMNETCWQKRRKKREHFGSNPTNGCAAFG